MKKKLNTEILKKLPKGVTENLDAISRRLHGRPLSTGFAKEQNISEEDARDLIQYMYDIGMITLKWIPEKGQLCIIRKQIVN
jgi:hypothetical protein